MRSRFKESNLSVFICTGNKMFMRSGNQLGRLIARLVLIILNHEVLLSKVLKYTH